MQTLDHCCAWVNKIARLTQPHFEKCVLHVQASEAATLNQSLSSIELAKPSFDSQLLLHDEREASGHEASAR